MNNSGRLIVIEGVDGAGKTTLARALVSHLKRCGRDAEYFSFPGRTPGTLGAEIYEIHHGTREEVRCGIHPVSLQLLHVAAHINDIEARILPSLKQGVDIVLDRFWWSTWVYGIVSGVPEKSLRSMIALEENHWGNVRPALVTLLERNSKMASDIDSAQAQRIDEYRQLAKGEKAAYPVVRISNDGTISTALKKLVAQLPVSEKKLSATSPNKSNGEQKQLELQSNAVAVSHFNIISRLAPAKPTAVYDSYWRFACERQRIFFSRQEGRQWPWTNDPVLREYKFTNAYRAADRVSQYLIKNVIYRGDSSPDEIFFRTLLFKVFNRIDTWELLCGELGEISYREYSFKRYDTILSAAMARGERVYSAAYIMPSGGSKSPERRKHSMHLRLIERMINDRLPEKIGNARSMAKAFEMLREYPTIGDFLAYQYVTDLNYGPLSSFSEMQFVVPGPGAFSGIHKCFSDLGGLSESEIIRVVTDRQEEEFRRLGLSFRSLWGRPLQLIDCQNLFCEVDKYARVMHPEYNGTSGRTRIKQRFSANPQSISYWFPPKWEINNRIISGGICA